MKRDVDLARHLLLDIEGRGADCSVSVLRTGPNHEAEERVRYHLRLLIDAGLLKEIDRAANGVPCVRLTDAGHEMIELTRSERRWQEAKWSCRERTGGESLTVIRSILLRWAIAANHVHPRRRYSVVPEAWVEGAYRNRHAGYQFEPYLAADEETANHDEVRYVRVRPLRRHDWQLNGVADADDVEIREPAASIPEFLI
jgi:hypothetical protein